MMVNEKKRLEALGFEQDMGGFWQRGDDLFRVTVGDHGCLSVEGEGWLLIAELLTGEDAQLGPGQPVEIVRLHFPSFTRLLAALESGKST